MSPTQTNYRSGSRSQNHSFTASLNFEVLLLLAHCDTDELFAKDSVNISFLADNKNLNNKNIKNFNISKLGFVHTLPYTYRTLRFVDRPKPNATKPSQFLDVKSKLSSYIEIKQHKK